MQGRGGCCDKSESDKAGNMLGIKPAGIFRLFIETRQALFHMGVSPWSNSGLPRSRCSVRLFTHLLLWEQGLTRPPFIHLDPATPMTHRDESMIRNRITDPQETDQLT